MHPHRHPHHLFSSTSSRPFARISTLLLLASLLLFHPPTTHALGLNCRGSSECNDVAIFHLKWSYNLLADFMSVLRDGNSTILPGGPISYTTLYHAGDTFACIHTPRGVGGICLFLGGNVPTIGVDAGVVLAALDILIEHGCQTCGSAPLDAIGGGNDMGSLGGLTSNYVLRPPCRGFCL